MFIILTIIKLIKLTLIKSLNIFIPMMKLQNLKEDGLNNASIDKIEKTYYMYIILDCFTQAFLNPLEKSRILFPDIIEGAEKISIGSKTTILNNSFLAAYPSKNSELIIGSECRIGRNNHIYAYDKIEIQDKVLTASNVYISDNTHSYKDYHKAILDQPDFLFW